jgi:hypothetical protein
MFSSITDLFKTKKRSHRRKPKTMRRKLRKGKKSRNMRGG